MTTLATDSSTTFSFRRHYSTFPSGCVIISCCKYGKTPHLCREGAPSYCVCVSRELALLAGSLVSSQINTCDDSKVLSSLLKFTSKRKARYDHTSKFWYSKTCLIRKNVMREGAGTAVKIQLGCDTV